MNYSKLRTNLLKHLASAGFCISFTFLSITLFAQRDFNIPPELIGSSSQADRPPTVDEIVANYDILMVDPDTNLAHAKKKAQRWMAYTFSDLNRTSAGYLSNTDYTAAMKGIHNSPFNCGNSDLADWSSEGPTGITVWQSGVNGDVSTPGSRPQQMSGFVSAIHINPSNFQEILLGARMSGIMRSTDGGQTYTCVTDGLNFPVLGIRQFLPDPDNSQRILALTGNGKIEGSVIMTDDGGVTWAEVMPNLPEFRWMSYHPSIDDLIFACTESEIYCSFDNGDNWEMVTNPTPPNFYADSNHISFYKTLALDGRLIALADFWYTTGAPIFECTYVIDEIAETVVSTWVTPTVEASLPTTGYIRYADISNTALNRFYLAIDHSTTSSDFVFESDLTGTTYSQRAGGLESGAQIGKSTLVASLNDPDIYYHGAISYVKRFHDINGTEITIQGALGELNGHHDDYRSFSIADDGSADRILFGNDGGAGLVINGLATTPLISSINGDLSINLIHAFHVNPVTGRKVFAFQDHAMVYEDTDGTFSNKFIFEGAFALSHRDNDDAIVGASITSIRDKSGTPFSIVNPDLSGFYLGGYQKHSTRFSERFAVGLSGGHIGLNKGLDQTEKIDVGPFQNQPVQTDDGVEYRTWTVGDIAFCEYVPDVIYAARESWAHDGTQSILAKTVDEGDSWTSISDANLNLNNGTQTTLNSRLAWREIRALAADFHDPDLLYCGIGRTNAPGGVVTDEELRVLRSTDGGVSFTDWSEGLTALPVEHLLTVESHNHLVFCATSVGIYYRNDDETEWQCFSEGLPKVEITGLQYDYCNNELYASSYGRGLWKTPVNIPITDGSNIIVSSNETWDTDRNVYTDIVVESGATLTVESTIRMGTTASIIVEQGGELILEGGTLTNACGEMWQGIQVHGNTNATQNSTNCGTLITKNDATIANAREAIRTWDKDNEDWNTLGGIVKCTDTDFINNKRNCEFLAYNMNGGHDQNYQAYFKRCHFEFNNNNLLTPNEDGPLGAVTLWGVKGVRFLGCTFLNTVDVSQSESRNAGIGSIDAYYFVGSDCSVMTPYGVPCPTQYQTRSEFYGYYEGVVARAAVTYDGPYIKEAIFDSCMVGISLDLAHMSDVVDNEITVGNHPYPSPFPNDDLAQFNTGVLTYGLSDFAIEENDFIGSNTFTPFTHGAVVQEGEGATVSIYRNKMDNLGSGAIGAGLNDDHETKTGLGEYGLRFICNENTQNSTDMEVRGTEGIGSVGFIDNVQSGLDETFQASGNILSAADGFNSNFVHMDFDSPKFYYYMHDNTNANETPNPDEIAIEPTPDGAIYTPVAIFENTCPTNYGNGGPVKHDYYTVRSDFYNLLFTYDQFIDQGNTEAALNEVALAWPQDAWDLRNDLMSKSPNNSDTVLIAAIDRNILPHGMLLEILVSNPDAINTTLMRHLRCCMADPMPEYMIDIIAASRNVQTARTLVERNLSNLRHKMTLQHRLNVKEMLRDSLGTHNDTLVNWLNDRTDLKGRYNLVSHYLSRGEYTLAQTAMDTIQAQMGLKLAKRQELNKMRQFASFLETIDNQGKNIAQLNAAEINYLDNMAKDPESGVAGDRAENILCFFYGMCTPPPSSPKSNKEAVYKPKPELEELIAAQNKIHVSPNPADQYVQLEYELLFAKPHTEMHVYDELGRKVSSYTLGENTRGVEILDTRKLVGGLYIVEIVQEGRQISSNKIIVQH